VPDERFDWLCDLYKPASRVPAYLTVVDIAGLVKGASEGQGLGNAFLSHIRAVDAIFHVVRIRFTHWHLGRGLRAVRRPGSALATLPFVTFIMPCCGPHRCLRHGGDYARRRRREPHP